MRIIYTISLAISFFFSAFFTTKAVPAKPGLIPVVNDGDTINIYLMGDENFHYHLSEDGYLLTENKGLFEFATVSSAGILQTTGIKASAPHRRTLQVMQRLKHIDRQSQLALLAEKRLPAQRKVMSRSTDNSGKGLFPGSHFPAKGQQKALIILVEYADITFNLDDPLSYFSRMLNETGFSDYGGTGSARDYFIDNSMGQFQPDFDVFGPVQLAHNRSYYGSNDIMGNDRNAHMMVIEACEQLDATVDFSQYDRDGDGFIDNVFVFYAGRGEASGGTSETVWPHSWNITKASATPYIFDNVQLDYYACTNEWTGSRPDGIGTFVHEFSHVMGLPDLYHTTNMMGAFTPGDWSVLDHGPYNNDGCTPPMYSAFERHALGWGEPILVDKAQNATLPSISSNIFAIIPTESDNEYFLLENRQQTSWDAYIPGHGMLVWHIDYNSSIWAANRVNNNRSHQYVDIEEADGTQDAYSRTGDAFPGTADITSFTDDTTPSMLSWRGQQLATPLTDITEDDQGIIRFKVKGGREPLAVIDALPPIEIGATDFIARWEAAPAESATYRLNVYRKQNGDITDMKTYNVANSTSLFVDHLLPDTYYYYTVNLTDALELSESSNEIEVFTGHLTIDNFAVQALVPDPATLSTDEFTARWMPLEDAVDYHINVYTKSPGEPLTDICAFDNKLDLPDGWSTDATATYSMASYAASAIPSLRLSHGQSCTTPQYSAQIKEISFWQRGNSTSADDRIILTALTDDGREPIASLPVENLKGGKTECIGNIPSNARAIEIAYTATGAGSLAIDDICIKWGNSMVPQPVEGYDNVSTGNTTTYPVKGLIPDTDYFYILTATDGAFTSKPSQEIAVRTKNSASIETAYADNAFSWGLYGNLLHVNLPQNGECTVCDIAGRIVGSLRASGSIALPSRGIYIISISGNGIKPAIIRF